MGFFSSHFLDEADTFLFFQKTKARDSGIYKIIVNFMQSSLLDYLVTCGSLWKLHPSDI